MAEIRIDLRKGTYFPGEEIKGIVHVLLEKSVSQRSAMLSLVGKERTKVTYGSGDSQGTATEESVFLDQETPLSLPAEENGRIESGNYDVPFGFVLPARIPATYKGQYARIFYEIRAKIDVQRGFDINGSSEVDVIPNRGSFSSGPLTIRSYCWDDPSLPSIKLTLERSVYGRGEVLSGRCAFGNPRSRHLRKIDVALKWIEWARAKGHSQGTQLARQIAQVPVGGRIVKGEYPFRVLIPVGAQPTIEGSLCWVRCILHVGLDIAFRRDVAVDQAIRVVVGRVEGSIPRFHGGEGTSESGKNTPEKMRRLGYTDHYPVKSWCYNCGASVGFPGATYCPNCGSRLRILKEHVASPAIGPKVEISGRVAQTSEGAGRCMICHSSLSQGDDVVWCPHCGGLAHRSHILEWIASNKSCPTCRKSLDEEDYR
jgi:DNA-directed RNA polymerase subunit RPC12/RpoP